MPDAFEDDWCGWHDALDGLFTEDRTDAKGTTYWKRDGSENDVGATTGNGRKNSHTGEEVSPETLIVFSNGCEEVPSGSYSPFAFWVQLTIRPHATSDKQALAVGYKLLWEKYGTPTPSSDFFKQLPNSIDDMQPVDWLIPDVIARTMTSTATGAEGTAKTTKVMCWANEVAGAGHHVVWLEKDEPIDTLQTRFVLLGADPSKLHLRHLVDTLDDGSPMPSLPESESFLTEALEQLTSKLLAGEDLGLVVLSPLQKFLSPNLSTIDDTDVARCLEALMRIGKRFNCAILGIMHTGKNKERDASDMSLGSTAWTQLCRTNMLFTKTEDHEEKLQQGIKCFAWGTTKAGASGNMLCNTFQVGMIEATNVHGSRFTAPRIVNEVPTSDGIEDIVSARTAARKAARSVSRAGNGDGLWNLEKVTEWITDQVIEGKVTKTKIKARALGYVKDAILAAAFEDFEAEFPNACEKVGQQKSYSFPPLHGSGQVAVAA